MYQVKEMTFADKVKMYGRCRKQELIVMLISANKAIETMSNWAAKNPKAPTKRSAGASVKELLPATKGWAEQR